MNKRVLITGGAGYIGSHVVKLFLEQGYEVVVFDDFSKGHREALDILQPFGTLKVIEGELLDEATLALAFSEPLDAVVHLAAPCIVDESMKRPEYYFEKNALGTMRVLEAMRRHQVQNIIFSSTCAVYGDAEYLPLDELHPLRPTSVYGEAKLMAENIIQWYGQIYNINYVIFRFFNACGADSEGLIGDSKRPSALLMPNAIRGALGLEEFKLTFSPVDTADGSPIRDYVDVEDLAIAIKQALTYLQAGNASDIFNIGKGVGWSVEQIVAAVENELGTSIARTIGEPREGEIAAIYANADKIARTLDYRPNKDLAASIKSLAAWYDRRPNGYHY